MSVGANAVNTAIPASANMHPNFFGKLQLKQRNAEVFERARPDAFHKPSLDFVRVHGPGTFKPFRMIDQLIQDRVRIEIELR